MSMIPYCEIEYKGRVFKLHYSRYTMEEKGGIWFVEVYTDKPPPPPPDPASDFRMNHGGYISINEYRHVGWDTAIDDTNYTMANASALDFEKAIRLATKRCHNKYLMEELNQTKLE